jgi:hypothetical protein
MMEEGRRKFQARREADEAEIERLNIIIAKVHL